LQRARLGDLLNARLRPLDGMNSARKYEVRFADRPSLYAPTFALAQRELKREAGVHRLYYVREPQRYVRDTLRIACYLHEADKREDAKGENMYAVIVGPKE